MSRNVSSNLRQNVFALDSGEAFIQLVTIDHADLSAPIRVTTDPMVDLPISGGKGVISNGVEYIALPFELTFPNEDEDQLATATIRIDNIDRVISQAIRSITSPPSIKIQLVLSNDPNTVEVELSDLQLRRTSGNSLTFEGEITREFYDLEPYPGGRYTSSDFPAIF